MGVWEGSVCQRWGFRSNISGAGRGFSLLRVVVIYMGFKFFSKTFGYLCGFVGFSVFLLVVYIFCDGFCLLMVVVVIYMGFKFFS